ncbi:MAG: AraC family transcriptional regulator [Acidobacteria bacterium]|nr:MAG: AraC family transcriptional regulator [Acidobacteriota bacterium]REJ98144.1 MAG: AraC family transcriptional regulator [Acidobacteriota bacterium]REK16887.1 MAG: AraC family transcriptional regulator [Acidobacteriota bacterium]REK42798.1 MAG: AraC family transcriptional regulator [Acidobacteriota bacterium]
MIFEMHIPGAPLNEFVQNFFFFDDFVTPNLIERFLPDGNTEIIISLRDEADHVYHNESLKEIQTCRSGWASGLRTRPISIPAGSGSSKLVIVFKTGMAHPFFPIPMSELSNSVVDADRLWGNEFGFLRERILAAAEPSDKFSIVEEFLLRRLNSDTELNPCVDFAVKGIGADPSKTNLAKLSDKIGYSQKHLISMFKNNVGTTPKSYLRVIRFQRIIGEIETCDKPDWPALALDAGFYDQAHFINDFKTLSGFTPNQYLERKSDALNYVPVL